MIGPDADPDVDSDPFQARPYALTGGRTQPRTDLDIISLVCATGKRRAGDSGVLNPIHAAALRLCAHPTSVAEVAAQLRLSIAVTKVILSDLIHMGVLVDQVPPDITFSTGPAVLEAVLTGLKSLSFEGSSS
jgi:hypothetical protein